MKKVGVGELLGDFEFQRPDGAKVRLHDYLGKPLVLIFLRHLA